MYEAAETALHGGTTSYREVMEAELATITAPLAEARDWLLANARVRPGLRELAARHDPLVVSGGFHELIEPLLAREGVRLEVRANRLDPRPDGWRIRWRDPEPCERCGDVCKRRTLPPGPFAFAGDGYSDRCAALAAARVFARDGLAEWLAERGVPFERFDDLHDVAGSLGRGTASE